MITNILIVPAFLSLFSYQGRYIFAYGGRGGAKSVGFAQICLERGRQKKLRILCCREIQKSIKDSVHTLLKDLISDYGFTDYEVQNKTIINQVTGTEFIFVGLREHNVNSMKSYANIDICWVEEAHAVTSKSLNILTPTIRKAGSQIMFSYNRYEEADPIHRLFQRELSENENKVFIADNGEKYKWVEYHGQDAIGIYINFDGNPFFPEALEKERGKDKIDDPELYLNKWLGHPVSQDDYSLISRRLVMESIEREVKDWNHITFGVDPARYGKDKSVLAIKKGFGILPLFAFSGIDNMRLVGEVLSRAKEYYAKGYKKKIQINIDVGYGTGVIDRLRELSEQEKIKSEKEITFNIDVNEINFGGRDGVDEKYFNMAASIWCNMKDALKTIKIPNDTELISELTTRKYKLHSDSQIRLVSKEEMRSKGLPSPDRGDAVALSLIEDQDFDFSNEKIENKRKE